MKRIARVYLDTSVVGGCFDEEFERYSSLLFEQFAVGKMIALISEITILELESAPGPVRKKIESIPRASLNVLDNSVYSEALAAAYVKAKVVPRSMYTDALHIAIATVEHADVVVSWNFKHLVNLNRIKAFNAVNMREGYGAIEIRTPREVLDV